MTRAAGAVSVCRRFIRDMGILCIRIVAVELIHVELADGVEVVFLPRHVAAFLLRFHVFHQAGSVVVFRVEPRNIGCAIVFLLFPTCETEHPHFVQIAVFVHCGPLVHGSGHLIRMGGEADFHFAVSGDEYGGGRMIRQVFVGTAGQQHASCRHGPKIMM